MQQRRTGNPDRPCTRGEQRESGRQPALFWLGSVYATPAVLAHLASNSVSAANLLQRHQRGDWGDLEREDAEANQRALRDGSRILSAYDVATKRIYIITEAASDDGIRHTTTLLFAEEY
jgi:hypothetical protein